MAESVGQWAKRAGTIAAVRDLETRDGRTGRSGLGTAELARAGRAWRVLDRAAARARRDRRQHRRRRRGGRAARRRARPRARHADAARRARAGQRGTRRRRAADGDRLGRGLRRGRADTGQPDRDATPDGGLRVSGSTGPVLGAGDTSHLLLVARSDRERDVVRAGRRARPQITPRTPVDFSRALGDVTLRGPRGRRPARCCPESGWDWSAIWPRLLAAAEAAADRRLVQPDRRRLRARPGSSSAARSGRSRRSSTCARAWLVPLRAGDRHRVGRRLRRRSSARRAPLAAAAAAAAWPSTPPSTTPRTPSRCSAASGSPGNTTRTCTCAGPSRSGSCSAAAAAGGRARPDSRSMASVAARRPPGRFKIETPSRQKATSELDEVRKAARLVATALSAVPPERRRKALAEVGYVAPGWPRPYGLGASPAELMVIDEELARVGVTRPELAIGNWAIPAIARHGTPAQLARFAEPTLRGDITWCQLFSEPEAGSDLASLRTRATRVDRRVVADRAEGLDFAGASGRLGDLPGQDRPGRAEAQGDHLLPGADAQPTASRSGRCAR